MSSFKAKTGKILFKDYLSFILFLFSIVSTISVVGIPLLIVWLPLLIRRVVLIKRVIEKGEVTMGVLARKYFSRGEWILWYVFKVAEQDYKVRNCVVAFKLPFKEKDVVSVAYDPQKPQKAFLTALYT